MKPKDPFMAAAVKQAMAPPMPMKPMMPKGMPKKKMPAMKRKAGMGM